LGRGHYGRSVQYVEEPPKTLTDPHELLLRYVKAYRDAARRKVAELPESELYAPRLPSGWTPLELLKHPTYMERRWFEWGLASATSSRSTPGISATWTWLSSWPVGQSVS